MPDRNFSQQSSALQEHCVSALGRKLRAIREQIEATAARGEIHLLNTEDLERELADLPPNDPDLR